ncbi:MAG TPA: hypothetical protein VL442_03785 [Mucilaginibacter sp.]|nr:hypothetical protein [Mucilaginibacter sp.]
MADTSVYNAAVNNMIRHFDGTLQDGGRLYNGLLYHGYESSIRGNPFLDDNSSFTNGWVDYDGEVFENVPMTYDVYADQLIVHLDNDNSYGLVREKVQRFNIHNKDFILINDGKLKMGYYEQLYRGKIMVINRIEKKLLASFKSSGTERDFVPVQNFQEYYIKKNGNYYSVSSQGDVLSVLADKKKELKQFIKKNNIQFDKLKEYSLEQIAAYYDRLTQ